MYSYILDLGVLISGGLKVKGVEIYLPALGTTCSLPQLPEARWYHTQDEGLACGGGGGVSPTRLTCVKWNSESGSWTQSHTLRQKRVAHLSWATKDGVYLMGGGDSSRTTKLVKEDGSVEDGFSLKYETK